MKYGRSLNTFFFVLFFVCYIWMLNCFSNDTFGNMYLAVVPALLYAAIGLAVGFAHRYILKLYICLSIFLASIAVFFKWRYHVTITEDILLSGLINDTNLTSEMLSFPLFAWMVLTALVPMALCMRTRIVKISLIKTVSLFFILLGLALVLAWSQGYQERKRGQIRDYRQIQALSSFSPVDLLYAFKKSLKAYRQLQKEYLDAKKTKGAFGLLNPEDDRLIVLVIGESSRGDHFELNGYHRHTSPKLMSIEHLYSFSHARSCDTLTIRSMQYMFSPLQCEEEAHVKQASFVQVLHSLGYRVELYSLQTLNAFYYYLGYDKLVSKYAVISKQPSGTKDISLLSYARDAIASYHGGKKLIVLHTLGSHQIYSDRVALQYKKFSPVCNSNDPALCSKEMLLNSYDNTIIAIDDFVSSIIGMLKNKKAMLVYLSDHGESLGENGMYFHGKPRSIAPAEQFNIPFVFWFSETYSTTREAKNFQKRIQKKSLDMPISHDYLYHSILGCSGVVSKSKSIEKQLNLCSEE